MSRANRHFQPGHVWHITHRCHNKDFLLKFSRDRARWVHWLFEARKRYRLCVLNYVVTSNHIHLLVRDTGEQTIARSMQLIAGRTAQEYNQRKNRRGAFWEDRYHATAIDTESHLVHCLIYIDLNMIRAGAVTHPANWKHSGYNEIQIPPNRYRIIDQDALLQLTQFNCFSDFQSAHQGWVNDAIQNNHMHNRQAIYSESIAVGGKGFLAQFKSSMGIEHHKKNIIEDFNTNYIKEERAAYNCHLTEEMVSLSLDNAHYWKDIIY